MLLAFPLIFFFRQRIQQKLNPEIFSFRGGSICVHNRILAYEPFIKQQQHNLYHLFFLVTSSIRLFCFIQPSQKRHVACGGKPKISKFLSFFFLFLRHLRILVCYTYGQCCMILFFGLSLLPPASHQNPQSFLMALNIFLYILLNLLISFRVLLFNIV